MSDTSENHATKPPSAIPDGELDEIAGGMEDMFTPIFWAAALVNSGAIKPAEGVALEKLGEALMNTIAMSEIDLDILGTVIVDLNKKQKR